MGVQRQDFRKHDLQMICKTPPFGISSDTGAFCISTFLGSKTGPKHLEATTGIEPVIAILQTVNMVLIQIVNPVKQNVLCVLAIEPAHGREAERAR